MDSKQYDRKLEWIGVDLDGTLAFYEKWIDGAPIGDPIPAMLERVKEWIKEGKTVKIFTARVADTRLGGFEEKAKIEAWCILHLGQPLPVTCVKDLYMKQLWDDRAVGVRPNTGMPDAILFAAEEKEVLERKLAKAQDEITRLEGVVAGLNAEIENNS